MSVLIRGGAATARQLIHKVSLSAQPTYVNPHWPLSQLLPLSLFLSISSRAVCRPLWCSSKCDTWICWSSNPRICCRNTAWPYNSSRSWITPTTMRKWSKNSVIKVQREPVFVHRDIYIIFSTLIEHAQIVPNMWWRHRSWPAGAAREPSTMDSREACT